MKKQISSNIITTTIKNSSLETANHTELKQKYGRGITWSSKTNNFELLIGQVGDFHDFSLNICQNWLKAHKTEFLCSEKMQQYQKILILLENIAELIEGIKTTIQCNQLQKLESSRSTSIDKARRLKK